MITQVYNQETFFRYKERNTTKDIREELHTMKIITEEELENGHIYERN